MTVATASDLTTEKTRDEIEKLNAEISQLREKWWQKPAYMASLVPIVAAICTLIGAWVTGYLNFERLRLTRDMEKLVEEKKKLESDIALMTTSRDALSAERTSLRGQIQSLEQDLEKIQDQVRPLRDKLTALRGNVRVIVWCEERIVALLNTLKDKKSLTEPEIKDLEASIKQLANHLSLFRGWVESRTEFLDKLPPLPMPPATDTDE